MLTAVKVSMIQQIKAGYSAKFIRDFDREWDGAVGRLRNSRTDLAGIPLVQGNTEYRKETSHEHG